MKFTRIATIPLVLLIAAALTACATVPNGPAPSLADVAGNWKGTFTNVKGFNGPSTLAVNESGAWKVHVPGLKPNEASTGTVRVENGVYRWKSDTTTRTGTWTLRSGTLTVDSDDGGTKSVYTR